MWFLDEHVSSLSIFVEIKAQLDHSNIIIRWLFLAL